MFAFAKRKRAACIGLNFCADAIRLLHLEYGGKDWVIKNYSLVPLPAGALVDGAISQTELLQEKLRSVVRATATTGYAAALALPASAVISQQISLPRELPCVEYEIAINMNLGRYFPGVSDVLYFDFAPLPISESGRQEVLLLAARQWQVDSYAALVNGAGLRVQVVDVDYLALSRAHKNLQLTPLLHQHLQNDDVHKFAVCFSLAMRIKRARLGFNTLSRLYGGG